MPSNRMVALMSQPDRTIAPPPPLHALIGKASLEDATHFTLIICPAMRPGWFWIAELEHRDGALTPRGIEIEIEGHEIELALSKCAHFDWHHPNIEWQLISHRPVSSPIWLDFDETARTMLPRKTLQ